MVPRTLLALFALCCGAIHLMRADTFEYTEDFSKFGKQKNNICPTKGVCAAIAAINSFAFLQNTHPGVYGANLLPNLNADGTDPKDARAFATGNWPEPRFAHSDDTPKADLDTGYYRRCARTCVGGVSQEYLNTKMDWFADHVSGNMTTFAIFLNPTISQLANEIKHQEDVEFFVDNARGTFNHAVTLTAVKCDSIGNCFVRYQDPNDPTVNQDYTHVIPLGANGALEFAFNDPRAGIVTIYSAFAESAVPEPSCFALLAAGFSGFAVYALRRRFGNTERRSGF